MLSEIGLQSVREGRRYTRALEDRRHLYFDGFTCRPLTRAFYDDRAVTFLDGTGLAEVLADTAWGAFTPVDRIPQLAFDPEALAALARLPAAERDRFNLPEQVISPTIAAAPEQLYLPLYVVRTIGQGGAVRYLAYTQASQEADPEWSQVCTVAVEVATVVENEYQSGRDEGEEKAARRWVERRFTGRFDVGWRDGVLIADLPVAAFSGADSLEPRRIGSFIKMDGWYFRLWCDDDLPRCHALLDLTDTYLGIRAKITADETARRLTRFCRQVALSPMSIAEVAHLARNTGKKALANQLDKLTELFSGTNRFTQQGKVLDVFAHTYRHRDHLIAVVRSIHPKPTPRRRSTYRHAARPYSYYWDDEEDLLAQWGDDYWDEQRRWLEEEEENVDDGKTITGTRNS